MLRSAGTADALPASARSPWRHLWVWGTVPMYWLFLSQVPDVSLPLFPSLWLRVSLPVWGLLQLWEHVWPFCGAGWGASTHRNSPAFSSLGRTILNCGVYSISRDPSRTEPQLPTTVSHSSRPPFWLSFLLSHFPTSWLPPGISFQMQSLHPTPCLGTPELPQPFEHRQPGSRAYILLLIIFFGTVLLSQSSHIMQLTCLKFTTQ